MSEWDEHAEGWDDNVAVRQYAAAAFESLTALLQRRDKSLEASRVLDFGCGTGLLAVKLAASAREVVALDPSAPMIAKLQAKVDGLGLTHVHPIASTLERANIVGPFDLIVCSSVCAFLDDYEGTVARLASMLCPGAAFVQFDWELDSQADEPFGLNREAIADALQQAGLIEPHIATAFEVSVDGTVMKPLVGLGLKPVS